MVGVLLAVLALTVQGIVFLFAFLFKIGVNLNPFEWGNSPSRAEKDAVQREEEIKKNEREYQGDCYAALRMGLSYDIDEIDNRAQRLFLPENEELLRDLEQDLKYIYGTKEGYDSNWTRSLMIAKYYHCLDNWCGMRIDKKRKAPYTYEDFKIIIREDSYPDYGWIVLRYLQRIEYYLNNAGKGDICKFVSQYGRLVVRFPEVSYVGGLAPITKGKKAVVSGELTLMVCKDLYVGCPAYPYTDYETDPEHEYVRWAIEGTGNPDLNKYLIERRVFEHTEEYDNKNLLSEEQIEIHRKEVVKYIKGFEEWREQIEEERIKYREECRKKDQKNILLFIGGIFVVIICTIFFCWLDYGYL